MKLKHVLYTLLILMLLLTVAERIPSDVWWIRVSDFPHVQITVITAICVIAVVLWVPDWTHFKKIIVALGVLAILYQSYIIFPYTTLAPTMVEQEESCEGLVLRILEANVYQENREYHRFIRLIETFDPDIVIGLETDQPWADTLQQVLTNYPYVLSEPLGNTYGMILFSKIPFQNEKIQYRINKEIPSFTLDLSLENQQIRMYVVHPKPTSPTESDSTTQRDAELVLTGREAESSKFPVIVVGDLNDVAWSHTTRRFQRISGLLDPRMGRGFYNTFNAHSVLLRYPLDHLFHSDDFQLIRMERTGTIGSDHFPLYTELCLNSPEGKRENEKPKPADQEDQEEGSETVKKAREQQ